MYMHREETLAKETAGMIDTCLPKAVSTVHIEYKVLIKVVGSGSGLI